MPPVDHSGYLGYDYSLTQAAGADASSHTLMLNWSVASYIVQPYIAQYFASITLRESLSDGGDATETDQRGILGNFNLRLFPRSHFPLEFYWLQEDQGTQQGENELSTSRWSVGLIQRYTARRGMTSRLHLEHVEQSFDDRVETGSQFGRNSFANLVVNVPLGKWNLNWDTLYRIDENEQAGYQRDRWLSNLRYDWRPAPELSVNGFATYLDTRLQRTARPSTRQRRADLSTYMNWRPATERPLTVTSVFRHAELLGGSGDLERSGSLTSVLGTANYRLTDRLSLLASTNATLRHSNEPDEFTSGALAEGRYSSGGTRLGPLNYLWNTSLGTRWDRREDEYGDVFSGIGRFGHSLDARWQLGRSGITTRLSQFASAVRGSDGESTQSLSQTLSASYSQRAAQSSSFLTLSLTDSAVRGGGGRAGERSNNSQFATLLFTQQHDLTLDSRLSGSLSVQVSRSELMGEGWEDVGPSGSADITYFNRMFMRVPLLNYRSSLRWTSSDFITSADDLGEAPGTDRFYWDNRFDYRIGMLEARLLLRFSRVNGEGRNLVYLSLRRYFGGRLN